MRLAVPVLLLAATSIPAAARVVSYAPVTNRVAVPVQQPRTSPLFVLVESETGMYPGPWGGLPTDGVPYHAGLFGRLVIHDAAGLAEPRVVLPIEGEEARFLAVACRPGADGGLRILAVTDADPSGKAPRGTMRALFSRDGGAAFRPLDVPPGAAEAVAWSGWSAWGGVDFGGPLVRGRDPVVRLASDATPFVLVLGDGSGDGSGSILAVDDDGSVRTIAEASAREGDGTGGARLVGTSLSGSEVLAVGRIGVPGAASPAKPPQALWRIGSAGGVEKLLDLADAGPALEGWVTQSGSAYLEVLAPKDTVPFPFASPRALYRLKGGTLEEIAVAPAPSNDWSLHLSGLFAVPTADHEGAWVLRRGPGKPTVLARHGAATGLVEKWSDPTAPEVEALHAGASGRRLLVQVHRPRPQMDGRLFKDPALALWDEGQGAPRAYDELFLNEEANKGFVHLDVETAGAGAPFVFDSGTVTAWRGGGPAGDGGAGGADVVQEWGVVKASLRQRLVVPAVARAPGARGAFWKSDLLLRNPGAEPLRVDLRFVPSDGGVSVEAVVTLSPREIRVVEDVLGSLFGVSTGAGALFLSPEGTRVVSATSRTWTAAASGTYGTSIAAVDVFAAASSRFPVTFAGGLAGSGYRTNAGGVDVAGRGASVALRFASESGWAGRSDLRFGTEAGGATQLDGLAEWFGVESWRAGALDYAPDLGEVVPFVTVIDELTNDPTSWRPDLPASAARAIPALVHADGRNGARFRSDLCLYNDSDEPTSVTFAAKAWDSTADEKIVTLTLFPRESKVVRDALAAVFRLEGVARVRFVSAGAEAASGVRVTSRAYTVLPGGGTYGVPLPPLNAFQMAGAGESIELFGVLGGTGFRTNLALVDLTPFADGRSVRARVEVIGDGGATLDAFDVNVPVAGGIQVDDLFRARGLGDGPAAALIRVSPAGGLVGAYATSLDQGTNDAVLVPAALAARD
jgi:hypothetical protein